MNQMEIVTKLHKKTKRDYIGRMNDEKVKCMRISRKYDGEYWDGDRRFGYGGYKFIDGYWKPVAEDLIDHYHLTNSSKILDVGCGKAFLLYEIKQLLPDCEIVGFDFSKYAIDNAKPEIQKYLSVGKAQDDYHFRDNEFDLVISINTLHNLLLPDLDRALREIERVGKEKFIVVESYRNRQELFNLQCWVLTGEQFLTPDEWRWVFETSSYTGDYELIYFE